MVKSHWREVLWNLSLPSDTIGALDWVSGLIMINTDLDTFNSAFAANGGPKTTTDSMREIVSTVTHETMHFLQIVTCGYLYTWASELSSMVGRSARALNGGPFQSTEEFISFLTQDHLPDPKVTEAFTAHVRKMGTLRRDLSVRALIESHATYVEYRYHYPSLDTNGYLELLADTRPTLPVEYRIAFDTACLRIGAAHAFELFPILVSIALCAADPLTVFDDLLTGVAQLMRLQDIVNVDDVLELAHEVLQPEMIGTSAEAIEKGAYVHPIYGLAVQRINDRAAQGTFNVLSFFSQPHTYFDRMVETSLRPIVLQPTEEGDFPLWVKDATPDARIDVEKDLPIAAAYRRLNEIYPTDSNYVTGQLDWLTNQAPPVALEVSPAQTTSGDISGLSRLDIRGASQSERAQLTRLFGNCILLLNGSHADKSRWIRRASKEFPSIVCYLAFCIPSTFMSWFGAVSNNEAWSEQGFDPGHQSVISSVEESLTSMASIGELLGVNLRPLARALLSPYPPMMAVPLIERAFRTSINEG